MTRNNILISIIMAPRLPNFLPVPTPNPPCGQKHIYPFSTSGLLRKCKWRNMSNLTSCSRLTIKNAWFYWWWRSRSLLPQVFPNKINKEKERRKTKLKHRSQTDSLKDEGHLKGKALNPCAPKIPYRSPYQTKEKAQDGEEKNSTIID